MAHQTLHDQLIERAMKDVAFRQELLTNPRAVLARDYQVEIPEQVTIRVIEDTPATFSLVLPPQEADWQELSDADLEAATGGRGPIIIQSLGTSSYRLGTSSY